MRGRPASAAPPPPAPPVQAMAAAVAVARDLGHSRHPRGKLADLGAAGPELFHALRPIPRALPARGSKKALALPCAPRALVVGAGSGER